MNEIHKFDSSVIMKNVKEKIKDTFVGLIPEEHWLGMCQKEIDDFFREDRKSRNNDIYLSNFSIVCNEVLKELSKEKIKLFLEQYSSSIWNNNQIVPNEMLVDLLKKHANEIFVATFANMFQSAISSMQQRNY